MFLSLTVLQIITYGKWQVELLHGIACLLIPFPEAEIMHLCPKKIFTNNCTKSKKVLIYTCILKFDKLHFFVLKEVNREEQLYKNIIISIR